MQTTMCRTLKATQGIWCQSNKRPSKENRINSCSRTKTTAEEHNTGKVYEGIQGLVQIGIGTKLKTA